MHSIDTIVQTYLLGIHTSVLTWLMLFATNVFEILPIILISLLVAVLIYYRKGLVKSFLFIVSLGIGEVLVFVFKIFFNVSRPLNGLIIETGKSFPSGHATAATTFFIMLIYIFSNDINKSWRWFFNMFCIFMIALVSFSRLYLGVHWLSDVLAGIILGLLTVYMSIKVFKLYDKMML